MLHRIFLAVNLPEEVKDKLSSYQERWPELPARWTKPDNLHLTLVFLGSRTEKEIEGVQKIAKEVAQKHKPFSFTLSQIMYGPSEKQPRMLWATGEKPKELSSLQQDLEQSLASSEKLSFIPEKRPFQLHLTLARFREWEFQSIEPDERPQIQEDISFKVPVSSLEVMESKLRRTGAEYTIVQSIPL